MSDDNVIPLDDVKPADRRKLNALDVKALSQDGAFWFALFVCLSTLYPPLGEWFERNKEAFIPLCLVLAGHFGIRMAGTAQKGKILSRSDQS